MIRPLDRVSTSIFEDIRREFPLTDEKLRQILNQRVEPLFLDYGLKLLSNVGVDIKCGACMEIAHCVITQSEHTCNTPGPADEFDLLRLWPNIKRAIRREKVRIFIYGFTVGAVLLWLV